MTAAAAQGGLDQPRPGRIGPREAAQLAAGAHLAGVTRGSARVVLELLLRHTRGTLAIQRSTRWIATNVGPSHRTARRALDDLVSAGLVTVVIPGGGRTVTSYLVNVQLLRALTGEEVTATNRAVHLAESADSVVPAGGSFRPPRGVISSPQGGHFVPPGGSDCPPRPRVYARAPGSLLPLYSKDPLVPQTLQPSPPGEQASPDDVGAPFQITGDVDEKCGHGRTVAQGGCRPCGTTARQLVDQREQKARIARIEQQRRDQANRRAEEAELQAGAKPAPEGLRASIRAGRAKR